MNQYFLSMTASGLGRTIIDGCRKTSSSKCTNGLIQPTFCAAIRIMHPLIWLQNHIWLSHELKHELLRLFWWPRIRCQRKILPKNEAYNWHNRLEKRVSMVWGASWACHSHCIWHQILSYSSALLYFTMLCRRALYTNFCAYDVPSIKLQ